MAATQAFREYATTETTIREMIRQLNHLVANLNSFGYLTIDTSSITTSMINWGYGADQVDAGDVPNTPAGNIAATTVQAAINELDTEKEAVANKDTTTTLGASDTKYPSQNAVKTYVDTGLGTKENVSNKDTTTTLGTSDTKYPSQKAVKTYVDTGLSGKENSIGYTTENVANKDTTATLGTSDTKYPSQKAVKTYVDTGLGGKEPTLTKGNLSAGSSKVSVTGGTNAVIGTGASVDVSEGNLTHNNIGSLQGGTSGEYYHMTSAQNTAFGNGITQNVTIADNDGTNYHHFTFTNGILTGYVKDTNP